MQVGLILEILGATEGVDMEIIGIVITVTVCLIGLMGVGSFAAIKIMRISMKLSEDYENRQQLEDLKKKHVQEIDDLRKQVNHLSEVLIEGNKQTGE